MNETTQPGGGDLGKTPRLTAKVFFVDGNTGQRVPIANLRKHPSFRGFAMAERISDGKTLTFEDNKVVF